VSGRFRTLLASLVVAIILLAVVAGVLGFVALLDPIP
jgi:hypothetical protein